MKVEEYTLPNGLVIEQINMNETNFMYKEIFEDNTYFKNKVQLKEGDIVFDIGANIGMFSIYLAQHAKNVIQYVFEPIEALYNVLCKNISKHCKQAKTYNVGFSNTSKTVNMTFYPNNSIMSSVYADKEMDEQCFLDTVFTKNMDEEKKQLFLRYKDALLEGRFDVIPCECTMLKLGDFIKDQKIQKVNLVKIDVEKSEVDILQGIEDQWDKIEQFIIEVNGVNNLEKVKALLEQHHYQLEIEACSENELLYMVYAVQDQHNN